MPWIECAAGQFVKAPGSETVDRQCAACGTDAFSTAANATACSAWTACAPGEFVTEPGTTTSDRQCAPCASGTFSAGTNAMDCSPWNDCAAGTYVALGGSAVADRLCVTCANGFSTTTNALSCQPWTDCKPGERVTRAESTSDRQCTACGSGTFSAAANADACTPWRDCAAGTSFVSEGTDTADRQCIACPAGQVSRSPNSLSCESVQIEAGLRYTCALLTDGHVRCWGENVSGNLGYGHVKRIGDNETPASAGDVNVGGQVVQIATGDGHTCAVLSNGDVRCWGGNGQGQLGYNSPVSSIGASETPDSVGPVPGGHPVRQIAAGFAHTCALLTDGRVRCWGQGPVLGYGQTNNIGDNETPESAGDVDIGGQAVQIAAGGMHTCALLTTGTVRCWGGGAYGMLGYGNTNDIGDNESPASAGDVDVGGPVAQITAGSIHTCALLTTGRVRCWGDGEYGKLGYRNSKNIGDDETPASAGDVDVGGPVAQIAAGSNHTCAVLTDGRVRCWGYGRYGQLGHGNTFGIGVIETPASAGDVDIGGPVTHIAAGYDHTCAFLKNGNVRCWGDSLVGQLGYGNTNSIGENETPASAGDVPVY